MSPEELLADGLVAILRAPSPEHILAAAEALFTAEITVLEVALTTPNALEGIARVCAVAPAGSAVGAGTVLSASDAERAIDAGARFLVSPSVAPEAIGLAADRSVPFLCGALTPTEIVAAHDAGAAAVKVFPAALGGPGYITAVREPLPDIPLVPTGGVALGDITAYLRAGAAAVGLGGSLIGDALRGGDLRELAARARVARRAVTESRAAQA